MDRFSIIMRVVIDMVNATGIKCAWRSGLIRELHSRDRAAARPDKSRPDR